MKVILLEKIHNLGGLGDIVNVKPGYGRNYLLPQGKAISATKVNQAKFEERRAELEAKANDMLALAVARQAKLEALKVVVITSKVHDENKLFGSVGVREVAHAIKEKGVDIEKREINLPLGLIHEIGEYPIDIILHSDVKVTLTVKVEPE